MRFNFCGKFKPYVSDSHLHLTLERLCYNSSACPKKSQSLSKSFVRAKRWGEGNGGNHWKDLREVGVRVPASEPGGRFAAASPCGQFLVYTPLMGVGLENGTGVRAEKKQDVCRPGSLAQTHISTNHTVTFLSLFLGTN